MPSSRASRRCGILAAGLAALALTASGTSAGGGRDVPRRSDTPLVFASWDTFTTRDGLPHDRIRTIRVDGDRVWVGTEGGLALLDGEGGWKSWTPGDGLPWPAVSSIDVDPRSYDLWLGTWGGGLARFSAGRFERFDQFNSGLAGDLVFAVVVAGGRVWAATNGGLSSFDAVNDTWDLYAGRRPDGTETVVTSMSVELGRLYATDWFKGAGQLDLDSGSWRPVAVPSSAGAVDDPARDRGAAALAIAAIDRSLWLATPTEVHRRDAAGRWEARSSGVSPSVIHGLAAPNDREIWLGTETGLQILADWPTNTWITFQRDPDARRERVTLRRDGKVVGTRVLDSMLPDDRIRCLAVGRGEVWLGTGRGLARGTAPRRWSRLKRWSAGRSPATVPQDGVERTAATNGTEPRRRVVGVLGPFTRTVLPGDGSRAIRRRYRPDPLAADLAAAQVNRRHGASSRVRFETAIGMPGLTGQDFGTPEDDFIRMARQDAVSGLLGSLGPEDRLASAVALHTELPWVNAASTPVPVHESINPWIFRCPINDPRQHRRLMDHVLDSLDEVRVAVLRAPDPLAQMRLDWWTSQVKARGYVPVAERIWDPSSEKLEPALRAVRRSAATIVLTWYDSRASAAILRRLRESGSDAVFVGSDQIVHEGFAALVGRDPGSVIAPHPCAHRKDPAAADRFAETYAERSSKRRSAGREAHLFYDATLHLIEAIDAAGPEREAVQRRLSEMSVAPPAHLEDGRWEVVDPVAR